MRIGVLALQGAFIEHQQRLSALGVEHFQIRQLKDIDQPFDGLILPGGESTTQGRLLKELGLFNPLKNKILQGLPTLGTCAGMILLATHITGESYHHLGTLPIEVTRNYYGRQLGSFRREISIEGKKIDLVFIRAPIVQSVTPGVEVLLKVDDVIVAVQYRNQLGLAFHPELSKQTYFHDRFLKLIHHRHAP